MSKRTALTPRDVIIAAYAAEVYGTTQQEIAALLAVSNVGRVGEAVKAMRWAAENFKLVHKIAIGQAEIIEKAGEA